jgi:hypothetical protein
MAVIIYFNPAAGKASAVVPVVDCGARVPEKFIGNMAMKISGSFELHGGAWVMPEGCEADEDLSGLVGIVRTHERTFLVHKSSGNEMKL